MTNSKPQSESADRRRATLWLSGAMVVLPLLQSLPIDFDRTAPLLLLLPAIWTGREEFSHAASGLLHSPPWTRIAMLMVVLSSVASIVFSTHAAASMTTAASWILLGAAALIGGQAVRHDRQAHRTLLAGLALGAALGTSAVWLLWLTGGRGAIPLYAHHRIFGLHVLVGTMATTGLVVGSGTRGRRLLWLAVGAVTWGAALWSGGRAPLVALAGGLVAWAFFRPTDRKPLVIAASFQLIAGLALSAAFWTPRAELGWWHAFARTAAAAGSGGSVEVKVSALTSTRSDFWRESAQHALTSPWIGHGPDAYRFLTPKLDGQQPHNFVLQLWLDVGIIGALPALLLLANLLLRGWSRVRRDEVPAIAPWSALLTTLVLAGLLDGIFYHVLTLLPAMLAAAVVFLATRSTADVRSEVPASELQDQRALSGSMGPRSVTTPTGVPRRPARAPSLGREPGVLPHAFVGFAIVILSFHAYLFHALVVGAPPSSTNSIAARALRIFPSTTFGLWTWLDDWYRKSPDTALDWARWAQTRATNPVIFHLRAAQYLHLRGEDVQASEELRVAETKAHSLTRPSIVELRKNMRLAAP